MGGRKFKNFKGKKVLVYGMGLSGQSACKLLHSKGCCVSFYDDEDRFGTFFAFDKNPLSSAYDFVVLSPGVKVLGNPIIAGFKAKGTPILSELDLGFLCTKGKIVAITGTNGKTTTVSLVGEIFKQAAKTAFVCGNIGLPLTSLAGKSQKQDFLIVEVSNFQLEESRFFKANTACILNLKPDHLDRHGCYEEYVRVKKKILSHASKVVLNFDDEITKTLKDKNVLFFSKFPLKKGVFVKNNAIFYNKTKIISLFDVPLLGEHNRENVLAAVAIAVKNKIKPRAVRSAIMGFCPPAHRLQRLGKVGGAIVYDDSKATNIAAVEGALDALGSANIRVLMGGRNKDFDFDTFFEKRPPLKEVICFGECGESVNLSAQKAGYNTAIFPSLLDAALYARQTACEGEIILLSPACASQDEFASYAVRGDRFKEIMFDEQKT